MNTNQPQQPGAFGPMAALLGMGLLGTVLFVLLLILLAPLILLFAVWIAIQRWRFRRMMRKAAEQMAEETDYAARPRKHIEVTVHPVEDKP